MRSIKKIVLSSPFTPEQVDAMCALAPEAEWHIFGKYGGDEEAMRDADVILGNVPPELLPKCEKLQWLHLCSAGTAFEAD